MIQVVKICRAIAASIFLLMTAESALAVRVISFEILIDDKQVLVANTIDQGNNNADQVWEMLKQLPFYNPADRSVLPDKEVERLRQFHEHLASKVVDQSVVLKGKVRVFCRYGGDIVIEELTLVRKDSKSPWMLVPERVEEMAKKRFIDKLRRSREILDADRQRGDEKSKPNNPPQP